VLDLHEDLFGVKVEKFGKTTDTIFFY